MNKTLNVTETCNTHIPNPTCFTISFQLLSVHPGARISSQRELQQTKLLRGTSFERILDKKTNPPFKPSKDHLNCDPSLELEEMIIETKPLHKKKKRLAKQRSIHRRDNPNQPNQQDQMSQLDQRLLEEFLVYNRFKEQKRKAMELKESEWQQELDEAMASSDAVVVGSESKEPLRLDTISEGKDDDGEVQERPSSLTGDESSHDISNNNNNNNNNNNIKENDSEREQQADSLDYIDRTPSPKPSI